MTLGGHLYPDNLNFLSLSLIQFVIAALVELVLKCIHYIISAAILVNALAPLFHELLFSAASPDLFSIGRIYSGI